MTMGTMTTKANRKAVENQLMADSLVLKKSAAMAATGEKVSH